MPAKDLGTKHTCFECGTRFYDLKKPAPICPKCGSDQRERRSIGSPPPPEKKRPPKPVVEPVAEVAEEELEEGDEPADEDEPAEEDDA